MKLLKSTLYCFCIIFINGCFTPETLSDDTQYNEQQYISFAAANTSAAGSKYLFPSYSLGEELSKVKTHYKQLKTYSITKGYSTDYAFIIDMRIPCFKKRFFVYDLKKDSLLKTALVAHGIGSETFKGKLIFSNIPESRQSSIGRYKIGVSYKGMWGFSYRLHGLDSTNSKALQRAIVLHSHTAILDQEVDDSPIGFSHGCPMISPAFLQTLKGYITKSKNPVLLSIIY